jgi:hypothetical protein
MTLAVDYRGSRHHTGVSKVMRPRKLLHSIEAKIALKLLNNKIIPFLLSHPKGWSETSFRSLRKHR